MSNEEKPSGCVLIAGPTASGKSALALRLARQFDGVVINADSMQVYADLRVVTARPSDDEIARAPHRLYGVLAGDDPCSAGRWAALALEEIRAAREAGKLPILVGGTGLYFAALTEGLSALPAIPADIRAAAARRLAQLGPAAFHAEVAARDPEAGDRLPQGDRQRLLRAWEVVEHTGEPLTLWQRRHRPAPALADWCGLLLAPPRTDLYARCDARFEIMLENGALAEVADLLERGYAPDLPVMKAVGVPELAALLGGRMDRPAAIAAAQQATRRYAKRQMTWFRGKMRSWKWLEEKYSESLIDESFSIVRSFRLTIG